MFRPRLIGCRPRLPVLCLLVALLAAGCGVPPASLVPAILPETLLPVRVRSRTLAPPTPCTDAFVPHTLDHVTTMSRDKAVRMFESNGAGVAVDDLDDDEGAAWADSFADDRALYERAMKHRADRSKPDEG